MQLSNSSKFPCLIQYSPVLLAIFAHSIKIIKSNLGVNFICDGFYKWWLKNEKGESHLQVLRAGESSSAVVHPGIIVVVPRVRVRVSIFSIRFDRLSNLPNGFYDLDDFEGFARTTPHGALGGKLLLSRTGWMSERCTSQQNCKMSSVWRCLKAGGFWSRSVGSHE